MKWLIFKNYNHMNIKITSLSILFIFLFAFRLNAQTPPNAFNYSAVARNAAGQPIANRTVGIQISILKTSTVGTTVYRENHAVNTDAFGLFNLVIGAGSIQTGSMTTINWSNDNYYLRVGMDANGGTNFLTMGTTQLLSVPYALYAKSAGTVTNSNDNDTSATNELQALSLKNDTIFLTNGGFVKLPLSKDTSATNELQTLTISNDTIFLTNGGFVKLPSSAPSSFVSANITTKAIVGITSNSATFGGIVSNANSNQIIERGIVYDTSTNPTVKSKKISIGKGIGSYDYTTSGFFNNGDFLQSNKTYYVRAYAITENNITLYGNEVSFTTSIFTPPIITTNTPTNISSNFVFLGGTISALNGNTVYQRGVVFSSNTNPTIVNSVNFETSSDTNERYPYIIPSTTVFYARAYVKTGNGIVTYGNQITFTTLSTGQIGPGGGIVFFDNGNNSGGLRYLECAPNDQSAGIQWGCSGTLIGSTNGSGAPDSMTNRIVAGCNETSFAAKECYNLVLGGKSDWYLPNNIELTFMHFNLYNKNLGNFSANLYWSSDEVNSSQASALDFGNGQQMGTVFSTNQDKTSSYRVRAIRAY
jgi:hypothetical protein